MIFDIILASALVILVISYWIFCRKRAFEYQKKAAALMKEYFLDGQVSDKDKQSLYASYELLRKWYIFPIFTIATPFVFCYLLVKKGSLKIAPTKRGNQELYDKAFDQLMKMALSKNPLISIVSMAFTGLSLAVVIPIGILLRRIYSVPSAGQFTMVLEKMTIEVAQRSHTH